MNAFQQYKDAIDRLRELRRRGDVNLLAQERLYKDAIDRLRELGRRGDVNLLAQERLDEAEDAILDEQDVLWERMSIPERTEAEGLSWRAWPESYDERMGPQPGPRGSETIETISGPLVTHTADPLGKLPGPRGSGTQKSS